MRPSAFCLPFILLCGASLAQIISFPLSAQQETREPEAATGLYQQQLVSAKHYMVSAAHPMATQAGLNILAKGGSAVDAAIAVQLMLGLVEPQSSGIGGGAFMLHWQATQQKLTGFDGRETAPKAADGLLFSHNGTTMNWRDAYVGGKSVGVPGVVAMLHSAHQQHGKLAWAELFRDTITAAEQGFSVSSRTARQLAMGWNKGVSQFYESKQYFFPQGSAVAEGSILKNPAYAATLTAIAAKGPDAFYRGELAKAISERVQTAPVNPGSLSQADMAAYRAVQRDALCMPYRLYKVCGMAPPSSGGVAVLQILGILQQFDIKRVAADSVQATHLLAQAAKLAFADRERYLADPAFVSVPLAGMLAPEYLARRAALIDLTTAGAVAEAGVPEGAPALVSAPSPELPNTSHFSIVDAQGNAVSMTSSIENVFGSGLMVGGFMLANHGHLQRIGIDLQRPERTDWDKVYQRTGAYEGSKLEAHFRVHARMAELQAPLTVVHPATVCGHSRSGHILPAQPLAGLISNLAGGLLGAIPGSTAHWLPLVSVDFLAELIVAAAFDEQQAGQEILALDAATPNLQGMLQQLAHTLGVSAPSRHVSIPLLRALLKIPGVPRLLRTDAESLDFIQTTRFDTAATDALVQRHGLVWPDITQALRMTARYLVSTPSAVSG